MAKPRSRVRWRRGIALPVPRYRMPPSEEEDGILLTNARGIILDVCPRICQLLDFAREELVNTNIIKLLHKEELARILRRRERPNLWASPLGEIQMVRRDGVRVIVEVRGRSLNKHKQTFILRDVTARKRAEEELLKIQKYFQTIYEAGLVGVMFSRADGQIFAANDELLRLCGYTRDDLEDGRVSWTAMTPPEYRWADFLAIEQAIRDGKCTPFEKEYVRKDGSRVQVMVGGVGLSNGMGVACVIDISRRKQAEEAIRATNKKVLEILESIGESFISLDREWRFKYINQRAATLLGMDPESLLGQTLWEKVPPLVGSPFEGHYRKAMSEQVASMFESRTIDGRWIEVRLHPSAEGLTIYVNDITARKRAEKAVRESEERLRFAVESARLMILDWMAAPGGEKVLEESSSSTNLGAPLGGGLDAVHPEDRERVAEARRRAAEGSGEYEAEFRLLREDGAEMWVRGRGRVTRDRSGAAARVTDVFADITEQKRLEAKVREQEARIAELTAASGALRRERMAEKRREEALALNEVLRAAVDGARGADGALGADGEALEVKLPQRGARIIADREELQRTLRDLLTSARRLAGGGGQVTVDVEADEQRGVAILTIRGAPKPPGAGRGAELTLRLPLERSAAQQPGKSLD